jgi:hypothetical protein
MEACSHRPSSPSPIPPSCGRRTTPSSRPVTWSQGGRRHGAALAVSTGADGLPNRTTATIGREPQLVRSSAPRQAGGRGPPLHLLITVPLASPPGRHRVCVLPSDAPEWHGIIGSRLMPTLLPQLQQCGFFARPLCVSSPSYVILLWPNDTSPRDTILPLSERLLPCLYAMAESAHTAVWHGRCGAPNIRLLFPTMDVALCDLPVTGKPQCRPHALWPDRDSGQLAALAHTAAHCGCPAAARGLWGRRACPASPGTGGPQSR